MKHHRIESFENLVEAFQTLPTIGRKSAVRLAYHLCMEDGFGAMKLAHAIESAVNAIGRCMQCNNMSEDELCGICADEMRDNSKLCIVQSARDILSIEEGRYYDGLYYVITKIDDLDTRHLQEAVSGVEEVIFAFPPSIATDAMILYIEDKLEGSGLRFTKIAQGVPSGVDLENIDMVSLSRAMEARVRA